MADTYKIGEAAALLNLKTYVLRFWETEFPEITPLRTGKGQRLYTPDHLALLERIRYLLHERGLTIGGARKILAEERARDVAYEFGAQGAVRGLDPEASPSALGGAAAQALPEDDDDYDSASLDDESGADKDGIGGDGTDMCPDFDPDASSFSGRGGALLPAQNGPVQCNLPGLGDLAAYRASLLEKDEGLDSGPGEGYGGGENAPRQAAEPQKGMLPLFAVARAAFLAGKASAGSSARLAAAGGDNFIQAGGPACGKTETRPAPDAELGDIAGELEAIAALLRAPAAHETERADNRDKGGLA